MKGFSSAHRWKSYILFFGDIVVFYVSLWLALFLREFTVPSDAVIQRHAVPFTILFVVWLIVFFIAGLYEKHTTILRGQIPYLVLKTQIINSIIAILFFYLLPYFGITPKTVLFIYLVISFLLIMLWRQRLVAFLGRRQQQPAILVGSGDEMHELMGEVNKNSRYGLHFVSSIDLDEVDALDFKSDIVDRIYSEDISTVVIDTENEKVLPILPRLYNLIFSHVRFIELDKVYEDIFDRVPLSLVQHSWFLENISVTKRFGYEFVRRALDVLIALPLFLVSLVVYPFVFIAQKIEGPGPFFYTTERIGKNNAPVPIVKFRTMTGVDADKPDLKTEHSVTRVGTVLRKTRIDELPQLWNVLCGHLSLIGPRPELPALVKHYTEEIPYYNVRHLVKPGLSGWGVIHDEDVPREDADVDKTRRKLSYDLYYIKNRSLLLDIKIALRTIKTLLSRSGR